MLWAGLIAFVLALVSYVTLEPSLWTVLLNGTELLGVVALFVSSAFRTLHLRNGLPRVAPRGRFSFSREWRVEGGPIKTCFRLSYFREQQARAREMFVPLVHPRVTPKSTSARRSR